MNDKYQQLQGNFVRALNSKNWNDVIVWSTELLQMDENVPMLWANRGVGLRNLGHHFDAILNYDRALALEDSANCHSNKGAAYWDLGNAEKALISLYKAIDIEPLPQTYLTLGNVYKHKGLLQKAIGAYRAAVQHGPDYADAHMVLGMALLKSGALQEGWKEFEWRWKTDQMPPRKLKCPQWRGEDLTNKIILVYGEQGLGDIIQFARYARTLGNQFPRCKVIVEGRPALKRLLDTMPEVYAVINIGEKLPELDYAVPMLSLAGMLTPNMNAILQSDNEYFIRRDDIEVWEERLKPLTSRDPDALKVGICWAGMARSSDPQAEAIDRIRSASLDMFTPLAKIPGILWVSLQKGPPASQVQKPPAGMTIGDFTEDMYDFYETCCAIENCDLVISVDTAVVHAAASISKPTWLLSRWDGCWRWFGDRSDSPWYPSLRQFVQPIPYDWGGMIKNVAKELTELAEDKSTPELNLTMAK